MGRQPSGVKTPVDDLGELLKKRRPFFLGLSVAIPFNLDNAIETIDRVKGVPELEDMKVMVGGKVFNDNPGLWKETEADAWSSDSNEAIRVTGEWWRKFN